MEIEKATWWDEDFLVVSYRVDGVVVLEQRIRPGEKLNELFSYTMEELGPELEQHSGSDDFRVDEELE